MDMMTSVPPLWMRWTIPTLAFIGCIIVMLIGFGIWDRFSPGYPRKGLLPIETTRGDRLFMGILFLGIVFCIWLKFIGLMALWTILVIGIIGAGLIISLF